MASYFRELAQTFFDPLRLAIWAIITIILTVVGPFGTDEGLTVGARTIYWGVLVGLSMLMAYAVKIAVARMFPDVSLAGREFIVVLGLTLFYTPVVNAVAGSLRLDRGIGVTDYVKLSATVFFVGCLVAVVHILALHTLEGQKNDGPPRLLSRLPKSQWGPLLRLTVEDHYVAVTTEKGTERLLMRFSDALREVEGIDGLRVHRSHWVARGAVAGIERENGRLFLILVDGARVPVSRNYRAAVEEAGIA